MSSNSGKLRKVTSNGYHKTDLAVLDIAKSLGLETGGFCDIFDIPKDVQTKYSIQSECGPNLSGVPAGPIHYCFQSDQLNIDNSDGTIIFNPLNYFGMHCAARYALTNAWTVVLYEPPPKVDFMQQKRCDGRTGSVFVLFKITETSAREFISFLVQNQVKNLCVVIEECFPYQEHFISFMNDALHAAADPDL